MNACDDSNIVFLLIISYDAFVAQIIWDIIYCVKTHRHVVIIFLVAVE